MSAIQDSAHDIVPAATVERINEHHRQAFGHAREALHHARQCGELLRLAKRKVGHGNFLPWLAANVELFGARQAQKYMRVAERWTEIEAAAKCEPGSHLTLRAALDCLAEPDDEPDTPEVSEPPVEPDQLDDVDRDVDVEPEPDDDGGALDDAEPEWQQRPNGWRIRWDADEECWLDEEGELTYGPMPTLPELLAALAWVPEACDPSEAVGCYGRKLIDSDEVRALISWLNDAAAELP